MNLISAIVFAVICGYVSGESLLHGAIDLTYSTKEGHLVSAPIEEVSPSFKIVVANRGAFESHGEQYYMENNHFSQVTTIFVVVVTVPVLNIVYFLFARVNILAPIWMLQPILVRASGDSTRFLLKD